jgi:hypothetical protein
MKLAAGEKLGPSELSTLREDLRRVERGALGAEVLLNPIARGFAHDAFARSGPLSVLPHEMATLHQNSFPTDTVSEAWTTMVWDETDPFSKSLGMEWTPATHPTTITVKGIGEDNAYVVCGYVTWEENGTGYREILVHTSVGVYPAVNVPAVSNDVTITPFIVPVFAGLEGADFSIQGRQRSGGNLEMSVGRFSVLRVR